MSAESPKTILIIASGPSLTREDVEYAKSRVDETIVVNDNYKIAPWAQVLYVCDFAYWRYYIADIEKNFAGEKWTRDPDAAEQFGLHLIKSAPEPGLSLDPDLIHEGENGGYQAINLAFHRGATRIVLLGFDMLGTGHWFGRHPQALTDATDFADFAPNFAALATDLITAGVEVVNCSRATSLTVFPVMTIDEALP